MPYGFRSYLKYLMCLLYRRFVTRTTVSFTTNFWKTTATFTFPPRTEFFLTWTGRNRCTPPGKIFPSLLSFYQRRTPFHWIVCSTGRGEIDRWTHQIRWMRSGAARAQTPERSRRTMETSTLSHLKVTTSPEKPLFPLQMMTLGTFFRKWVPTALGYQELSDECTAKRCSGTEISPFRIVFHFINLKNSHQLGH